MVFCLLIVGVHRFSGLRAKGEVYTNNDRRPNHYLCSFLVVFSYVKSAHMCLLFITVFNYWGQQMESKGG